MGRVREFRSPLCGLTALVLSLGWAATCDAAWTDQGHVLTIIEENDLFVNTDRHYTQGFKLSFLGADDAVPAFPAWLSRHVPRIGFGAGPTKFGYHLGQSIFTPGDLRATERLTHDRPYAGWLYTGVILQRRGTAWGRSPVLENFQIDAGVIGPHSLADEAQTWVHELRGFDTPRGWRHQLRDEPGLAVKYQRAWLFSRTPDGPRALDIIPHVGVSLGNVDTSLRAGGTLRFGWRLPDDFGVSTISSLTTTEGGWSRHRVTPRWGLYGFAGAEASAVLYTAFLDGNLFRPGHHVEKEPFVVESKAGIGLVLDVAELTLTYVYRTPQFVGQRKEDVYGSVSLKLRF